MSRFVLPLVLVTGLIVASCSSSDDTVSSVATPTSEQSAASTATVSAGPAAADGDVETFCATYAGLQGEKPEEYVGSPEHVADIESLLAVATPPVVDDLTVFRDYVASGVIDSTDDPESNLTSNWPDDVQQAVAGIQKYGADNC